MYKKTYVQQSKRKVSKKNINFVKIWQMTTSNGSQALLNTLEILKGKIDSLVARNESLLLRNSSLEEENRDLRKKTEEAYAERDRARLDAEFLAVSHKLANDADDLVAARRHIAGLIRNIDRCLEILKE